MLACDQRRRIVALCQDLSRRGYFAATGGNLALRLDAQLFLVTPSATDYFRMTEADVCVVRLADLARVEGDKAPSVETGLHARVLRYRPDVICSLHTHQPLASAWSLVGAPLEIDDPDARKLIGLRAPLVGYAPSGTSWLSWKLGRALRPDINGYLLRNHGALCCGGDVEASVGATEVLERVAAKRLRALISAHAASGGRKARLAQAIAAMLEDM